MTNRTLTELKAMFDYFVAHSDEGYNLDDVKQYCIDKNIKFNHESRRQNDGYERLVIFHPELHESEQCIYFYAEQSDILGFNMKFGYIIQ